MIQNEKYSITRKLEFCAGHRVYLHESKCAHPHGHQYTALITIEPKKGLDELGRVIDFSVVKGLVGTWIDQNWDHGFIYYERDLDMRTLFEKMSWKSYCMPTNPTSENLADHLINVICPELFKDHDVICTSITLWETPNCYATVKAINE